MLGLFIVIGFFGLGLWAALEKANLCRMPHFMRSAALKAEMMVHTHDGGHHEHYPNSYDNEDDLVPAVPTSLVLGL